MKQRHCRQTVLSGALRLGLGLAIAGSAGALAVAADPRVRITEVLASNRSSLADENGDHPDWFELHNEGDMEADLTGWGLSDDPKKPFKWQIRETRLGTGAYLVVFASGKDRQPGSTPPVAPESVPGLCLWLKASSVATNDTNQIRRSGANLLVRRWVDLSSRHNDALAAALANQPQWLPAIANGSPAIRFDGIDDGLRLAGTPATNDFCILAVARANRSHENDPEGAGGVGGVAGQRYLFGALHGGDFNSGAGVSMGTNGLSVYEHGSGYMPALAVYAGDLGARFHVVTVNYRQKQPGLFVDGLIARTGAPSPRAQVTAPVEIGSGAYGAFGGDLAEILVYPRALDESERSGIEAGLARNYAIETPRPLHTNFQLDAGGEELVLTRPDGSIADRLPFGRQRADVSFGRSSVDDEALLYFGTPTPGSANTTPGSSEILDPPEFSLPGGFFDSPQGLELTSPNAGTQIRYTVDGSEPTENSVLYTGPIALKSRAGTANRLANIPTVPGGLGAQGEVFKGWPIRARSFKAGALPSTTATRTFWIDARGRGRYTVPVVSLVTPAPNFFDANLGIYVPGNHDNYNQRGPEWERPVHVELIEPDNTMAIGQEADAKIHGNTSQGFPIKGLDLDATGTRSRRPFRYRFFPDRARDTFEHILLRPTGHDQPFAFMRDELMQSLGAETGAESQAARLCVVFVNGEYWGLHYLKEKQDAEFVAYYSNHPEDELDYLEGYAAAKAGTLDHYAALLDLVGKPGITEPAIYADVGSRMEIPNYIDYKACEIFFYRWDIGNHRLWRPRTAGGRWRWLQFDNDVGWGGFWAIQPAWQFNMLAADLSTDGSLNGHNNETTTFLLRKLITNPVFRRDFINRSADLMNTLLLPAHSIERIDSFARQLEPEMAEHIRRWRAPGSVTEWRANVDYLRTFAVNRPNYVRQHLQQRFALGAPATISVAVSPPAAGGVRLNSLTLTNPAASPFSGRYFRNHPLPIAPEAAPGYRFAGWQGLPDATTAAQVLTPSGDLNIVATFEAEPQSKPILRVERVVNGGGLLLLLASGTPATTYGVETSENGGAWTRIDQVTLDAQGQTRLPLGQPSGSVRFYRLVSSP